MHLYYSGNFVFGKICKGNIITEKEGKTGIVILEIEGISHAARQLIYKTEDTLVLAGMLSIHKIAVKEKP